MPLDTSRVNLDLLHRPFRDAVLPILQACPMGLVLTWGLRNADQQNAIVGQGRGVGQLVAMGLSLADARRFSRPDLPRVSNAIFGNSSHNWGCAVDVAVDADLLRPGLQPDWDPTRDTDPATPGEQPDGWYWLKSALAGHPLLRHGEEWGDWPHIEWRAWRKVKAAQLRLVRPAAPAAAPAAKTAA